MSRLRKYILSLLHESHPYSLSERNLLQALQNDGWPEMKASELKSQLVDMKSLTLVETTPNPMDAAETLWKRTEAGRVALVQAI
jgi:hypothetical protein